MKSYIAECSFSKIYILESLENLETHTGTNLARELISFVDVGDFGLELTTIEDAAGFERFMQIIKEEVIEKKIFPLLQLDIHGDKDKGFQIQPSGEFIPWNTFANLCKEINLACDNNLIVVMSVCHGFKTVLNVKITDTTPFYCLIGPEKRVVNKYLECKLPEFYRTLLSKNSLLDAYNEIKDHYSYYLCEKIFVNSFVRYLIKKTRGKGRQERVENLLTQTMEKSGNSPQNLKKLRKYFKSKTLPENSKDSFEEFRNTFLLADRPDNSDRFQYDYDNILNEIKNINFQKKS